MKMIRRIVALTFAGLLCAAFSFTALGAAKEEKTAYSFTYAEQQVTPGETASAALIKLGDYQDDQVLANCADDSGTATAYIYSAFDLVTQKIDGKEVVKEITIHKDGAATEEGLKVGDTPSQVKKLYPSAVGDMGLYTVELGSTRLVIDCGFKDDKVVSITYEYVTETK